MNEQAIQLFETKKVCTVWNTDAEEWYFSVVDVVAILTEIPRPRKYWNALKTKLKKEGSELSQNMGQLKLISEDGKNYLTDVASVEQITTTHHCGWNETILPPIRYCGTESSSADPQSPTLPRHCGLDPQSPTKKGIPAFAGMTLCTL